jgi:hypothetical protein
MVRWRPLTRALIALAAAAAVVAIANPAMGDYAAADSASNDDNAAPALAALIDGDLGRALEVQPVMGPVTVALRWPFAAAGHALGGRGLEYAFGAAACLWILALLAIALARRAHRLGGERLTGPVVLLLLIANPVTLSAMEVGHPEELVAAALATLAVLLAGRDRAVLTGLVLAAAAASKPTAALAAPVALLVLQRGHWRAIAAGAVAAAALMTQLLANHDRVQAISHELRGQDRVYAASAWWPLADEHAVAPVGGIDVPDAAVMPGGLTRSAGQIALAALTLALAIAYFRRRDRLTLPDGLSLLAGLMLARCLLDPVNLFYYAVPFVVALVAWETYARRGIPLVSIVASAALWATVSPPPSNPDLACALFLAWAVPASAWLTVAPLARLARRTTGNEGTGGLDESSHDGHDHDGGRPGRRGAVRPARLGAGGDAHLPG